MNIDKNMDWSRFKPRENLFDLEEIYAEERISLSEKIGLILLGGALVAVFIGSLIIF